MIERLRDRKPSPAGTGLSALLWGTASFVLTALIGISLQRCHSDRPPEDSLSSELKPRGCQEAVMEKPSPFRSMIFPTGADLLATDPPQPIFMPTASGKPESALFGSVRTGSDGRPRFHEGIDIAPQRRDRRGIPLDEIFAVADGKVSYINRTAGDSSYGNYIVLTHDDPAGPIYSLYAHMASIEADLKTGSRLVAGTRLGIMGHSANTGIPVARGHLHLEIGVMLSDRFGRWAQAQKLTPDRGNWHGWNLFSLDSLDIYKAHQADPEFSLCKYIAGVPAAFQICLAAERLPGYFRRYCRIWQGPADYRGPLVLRVGESGVILSGRPASLEESTALPQTGKPAATILAVDEEVLGRNALRFVVRGREGWTAGPGLNRWLELLFY